VCGDRDEGFSKEVYEETARLIPDCTLRMYEGFGHMGVANDKRFAQDVIEFVRQQPATPQETGVEQRAILGELVGTAAG
jgi:hypothetical protein